MKNIIDNFSGEYSFLSNFYKRAIPYKNKWFPTSEHAYQSEKTENIFYIIQLTVQEEINKFYTILNNELTPGQAKRMYSIKNLNKLGILKKFWFDTNLKVMENINYIKFTYFLDLKEKLLQTDDSILIEGNYWGDKFYGMIKNEKGKWEGENHLGKILMKIREKIRKEN